MGAQVAEYLRARRAVLRPHDVGLPEGVTRRRVAGLRREELAELAGLSPEYYVRLEQGRGIRPSHQVLRSLAAAFRLDGDATRHLYRLARLDAGEETRIPRRTRADVPTAVIALLRDLAGTPALVVDSNQDIVIANAAAANASGGLLAPHGNLARAIFVTAYRERAGASWATVADWSLSALRYYGDPGDDRFRRLLVELQDDGGAGFLDRWIRHDAHPFNSTIVPHWAPGLGPVEVDLHGLEVHGCEGLFLVVARGIPEILCRRGWSGGGGEASSQPVAVGS